MLCLYCAAYLFARRRRLPLVIIVHDDPEEFERQSGLTGRIFRQMCKTMYQFAAKRLCVSPQMRDLFEKRYRRARHRSLSDPFARFETAADRRMRASAAPRQTGDRLHWQCGYGYGETLNELAPIFAKNNAVLRIYSRRPPDFSNSSMTEYAGGFEPEQVWDVVKRECDVVLLPYSFHPVSHQNLYRTHFPSKLPDNLGLGMPVIITGPEYATGVIWGLNNPAAAVTICHSDKDSWIAAVRQLIDGPGLRMKFAQAAVEAGNRDFEPETIRAEFRRILSASVESVSAR